MIPPTGGDHGPWISGFCPTPPMAHVWAMGAGGAQREEDTTDPPWPRHGDRGAKKGQECRAEAKRKQGGAPRSSRLIRQRGGNPKRIRVYIGMRGITRVTRKGRRKTRKAWWRKEEAKIPTERNLQEKNHPN